MSFGYAMIGKANNSTTLIPSLIGILSYQEDPSPEDRYFARFDIDDYRADSIDAARVTQWVDYDSMELGRRDPILAVSGRCGAYFIPLSELIQIAQETSDLLLLEKLEAIVAGRLTGWGVTND